VKCSGGDLNEKKPFRRQSHRREANTESGLIQMASDVVKEIRVARVKDNWQVVCKDGFFYLKFHKNPLELSICRSFPFKTTWLHCASYLLVDDTLISIRFLHTLNFVYFVDK
jgi:hypothetical protein